MSKIEFYYLVMSNQKKRAIQRLNDKFRCLGESKKRCKWLEEIYMRELLYITGGRI